VVVPDSMRDPLGYYRNNTMTTRSLLNAAVKCGVNRFIFSSTAAVYGNPDQVPVPENAPTRPLSPYGSSKLMTEIMLHDVAAAHGMNYVVLRYFNVAGADPQGAHRACHRRRDASAEDRGRGRHRPARQDRRVRHRLSDAGRKLHPRFHPCQRPRAGASRGAVLSARRRASVTLNCGYGRGYSVLETIEAVRRVSGRNFAVQYAPRRPGDIMTMVADTSRIRARWTGRRNTTISRPSPPMRWPGKRSCSASAAAAGTHAESA
jgi:UDP-glucose 4-epimerase